MATASFASGIAGRYATALFELARDAGQIDALDTDMDALGAALDGSADFKALISSPVYSREDQARAVGALVGPMGLTSLTGNTLQLMATKRRLFVLPALVRQVREMIREAKGIVAAEVTSAKPLTDAQRDDLAAVLKAAAGRDIAFDETVDPSLIGGLVVKLGSRMIDTSIRAKLTALQTAMKEAG